MELVISFPKQPKIVPINPDLGDTLSIDTRRNSLFSHSRTGRLFSRISSVSKDLCVDIGELPKFLNISLEGSSGFNKKRKLHWISGEHSPKDVEEKYRTFLSKLVICETCGQPELERRKNVLVCRGDGSSFSLKPLDLNDRFLKFLTR
ncbi:eukaryotic translation initiation factor 5 [Port-miou virus]|uniref:Eukaryotic translation initiation factor 5 n=1 Tax=Port-miou virus TaxID=1733873 RepID=A0A0N9PUM2_9VIRU|nr:eukaryotic translation initiation factor 5 [Port-miou virus]